jgi:hypothetical protein
MPAIIPENNGAFEARAMPRHKGNATNSTTTEADRSWPADPKLFFMQVFLIMEIRSSATKKTTCLVEESDIIGLPGSKGLVENND